MKKVFYSLTVLALMFVFASCGKNNRQNFDNAEENLELRAATLGFSDTGAYKAHVAAQCATGNHENCCILNGKHQACTYPHHLGTNCDGTHRHGAAHGNHDGKCNNLNCTGFVDADSDGKCDNCTDTGNCTQPQDGTGNQHGGNHH